MDERRTLLAIKGGCAFPARESEPVGGGRIMVSRFDSLGQTSELLRVGESGVGLVVERRFLVEVNIEAFVRWIMEIRDKFGLPELLVVFVHGHLPWYSMNENV